jgi:hypothetical protein
MSDTFANSVFLLVLGAVVSFASAWFWFQKSQSTKEAEKILLEHEKLLNRIKDLEIKEAIASAVFIPIATAFQDTLIKSLTHSHAGELNALLLKVVNSTLTPIEEPRLLVLLQEITKDYDPRITKDNR